MLVPLGPGAGVRGQQLPVRVQRRSAATPPRRWRPGARSCVKAHPGHPRARPRARATVAEAVVREPGAPGGDVRASSTGSRPGVRRSSDPRGHGGRRSPARSPGGRALFDIAARPARPDPVLRRARQHQPGRRHAGRGRRARPEIAAGLRRLVHPGRRPVLHEARPAVPARGPRARRRLRAGRSPSRRRRCSTRASATATAQARERLAAAAGVAVARRRRSGAGPGSLGHPAPARAGTGRGCSPARSAARRGVLRPGALVVEYDGADELLAALAAVAGSLTATVHAEDDDTCAVGAVARGAARRAPGGSIWNGWPTGVAVAWAMQHGGPWPATTAPRTPRSARRRSGGCCGRSSYQGIPSAFLPPALQDGNPWSVPRRVDGAVAAP